MLRFARNPEENKKVFIRLFLEQEEHRRDRSTDEGTIPSRGMLREGRNSFRDRKAAALAVISAKYRPFPPMSSALSEGLGMRALAAPVLRGVVGTVGTLMVPWGRASASRTIRNS